MSAGTIFVLCLAAGFVALILYLHHLSQPSGEEPQSRPAEERPPSDRSRETPRKRAS